MRCRRIVFKAPRQVAIEDTEVPDPSRNQVLVRTKVTLISTGTELTMLNGEYPKGSVWDRITEYPLTPGYSNCGIVEKKGGDVINLNEGDRVTSTSRHSEYVLVNTDKTQNVPDEVSDDEATFATLANTVMNSVRIADIKLGETVVIVGAGILGQLASQFSRLCGAHHVIVVDLSKKRLQLAKKLGANSALQPGKVKVEEEILKLTGNRGGDVVFEVTGNQNLIPWELDLVRRQGRLIILSSPRGTSKIDFHDLVNWPSKTIIGTHASSQPQYMSPYNPWTSNRNIELFFNLICMGKIDVKSLITNRYPWKQAVDVYNRLLDPIGDRLEVMGVLLDFKDN